MLIFRGLHIGLRKEKIQGTYFKICALNFEICPTYFWPRPEMVQNLPLFFYLQCRHGKCV